MNLEDLQPLGLVAGPFLAGVGLRAAVPARWALAAIGALAAALLVASLRASWLNPADVLFSALLAGVGVGVAGQSSGKGRLAALGGVLLFVITGEGAARLTTSPVPGEPSPLAIDLENMSSFCTADATRQTRPLPTDSHYVLHLGDSMIAWAPAGTQLAVARLDASDTHAHAQAGIVGTGPDCALLVLRDMPPADLVVLHLFAFNDLADLDAGYAWCDGQSLFDYDTRPPTLRCPDGPAAALGVTGRVMATPAPWVLRWARSRSAMAVLLTDSWEAARYAWPGADRRMRNDREEARLTNLGSVLQMTQDEVRAHGGTLVVSLVPIRKQWLDPTMEARLARLRATLDQVGVPTIDGSHLLADAEDEGLSSDVIYANDRPGDPHLAEEGQRRYAAWLAEALAPWLAVVPRRAP
jgi:hypothetical protein